MNLNNCLLYVLSAVVVTSFACKSSSATSWQPEEPRPVQLPGCFNNVSWWVNNNMTCNVIYRATFITMYCCNRFLYFNCSYETQHSITAPLLHQFLHQFSAVFHLRCHFPPLSLPPPPGQSGHSPSHLAPPPILSSFAGSICSTNYSPMTHQCYRNRSFNRMSVH